MGTMMPPETGTSDAQRLMLFDANKKNVVLAYAFLFVLWWSGAHRFYVGKKWSGAAMLVWSALSALLLIVGIGILMFAVVAIWAFVDAFLVAGWVRDYNTRLAVGQSAT